ncbi:recombinase family protein [Psychroflexus halocasei]|uniref:Site-specific DNA recombinase n=1 Tax=Psychroflexus halocasei TaxID=908615 RepID=A0A1H4DYF3_9FLAO|nr:recombinase family protein [Psychroflexus halocasei]SEA77519.1 Site-specific DNA recombinase [Psychroflexus halocasei]
MKARYIRTSTPHQNNERQKQNNENELLYIDVCSGAIAFNERQEGQKLINDIKQNKINYVAVHSVSRLGRNLLDILTTLKFLNDNKVTLKVENLGLESRVNNKENQAFNLIISVMGQVADIERVTMLERQKEGIKLAKLKGTYKGRVKGSKESTKDFLNRYPKVIKNLKQGLSIRKTSKVCGVSDSTTKKVKRLMS